MDAVAGCRGVNGKGGVTGCVIGPASWLVDVLGHLGGACAWGLRLGALGCMLGLLSWWTDVLGRLGCALARVLGLGVFGIRCRDGPCCKGGSMLFGMLVFVVKSSAVWCVTRTGAGGINVWCGKPSLLLGGSLVWG